MDEPTANRARTTFTPGIAPIKKPIPAVPHPIQSGKWLLQETPGSTTPIDGSSGNINAVLTSNGFPAYEDATPDISALGLGRCSLDHFGGGGLSRFSSFARQHDLHGAFDASGVRDVFLPIRFDPPLLIPAGRFLWFTRYAKVGSLHAMVDALHELAPFLGIPIDNNDVTDPMVALIDDMEPLFDGDDADVTMREDLRMAWLLYHEAANLAMRHNVALALGA